ncbi:hypothetical protein AG1IA_04827 [Rhizoctonia solani AG-1 IA]|uniref:Uncharacterized protein n=1 Tax=Thanatephorus cucumeris (strain AG1-IA) TaxID=983506 RepID=L8WWH6_THACA|nr:hypothetical protein AG1IA_04827 [Rhizoctonia solani AG-1 IA]
MAISAATYSPRGRRYITIVLATNIKHVIYHSLVVRYNKSYHKRSWAARPMLAWSGVLSGLAESLPRYMRYSARGRLCNSIYSTVLSWSNAEPKATELDIKSRVQEHHAPLGQTHSSNIHSPSTHIPSSLSVLFYPPPSAQPRNPPLPKSHRISYTTSLPNHVLHVQHYTKQAARIRLSPNASEPSDDRPFRFSTIVARTGPAPTSSCTGEKRRFGAYLPLDETPIHSSRTIRPTSSFTVLDRQISPPLSSRTITHIEVE